MFLTRSKTAPFDAFVKLVTNFGCRDGYRAIRVDQGGELARSSAFRQAVHSVGYVVEPTGSDTP